MYWWSRVGDSVCVVCVYMQGLTVLAKVYWLIGQSRGGGHSTWLMVEIIGAEQRTSPFLFLFVCLFVFCFLFLFPFFVNLFFFFSFSFFCLFCFAKRNTSAECNKIVIKVHFVQFSGEAFFCFIIRCRIWNHKLGSKWMRSYHFTLKKRGKNLCRCSN